MGHGAGWHGAAGLRCVWMEAIERKCGVEVADCMCPKLPAVVSLPGGPLIIALPTLIAAGAGEEEAAILCFHGADIALRAAITWR